MVIDQAAPETGQEAELVRVKLDRGTVLFGCGDPPTNVVCNVQTTKDKIIPGTPVCAYVRMIDGQLYGGKIFLHSECLVSRPY